MYLLTCLTSTSTKPFLTVARIWLGTVATIRTWRVANRCKKEAESTLKSGETQGGDKKHWHCGYELKFKKRRVTMLKIERVVLSNNRWHTCTSNTCFRKVKLLTARCICVRACGCVCVSVWERESVFLYVWFWLTVILTQQELPFE